MSMDVRGKPYLVQHGCADPIEWNDGTQKYMRYAVTPNCEWITPETIMAFLDKDAIENSTHDYIGAHSALLQMFPIHEGIEAEILEKTILDFCWNLVATRGLHGMQNSRFYQELEAAISTHGTYGISITT